MKEKHTGDEGFSETPVRISEWRRFRRVFFERKIVIFGFAVLLLMVLTAIFAPLLAPYDPYEPDMGASLVQPNGEHLLGTDLLGRDTLSRLIYGSRTALAVGFITVALGGIIGIMLGIIAGYAGGAVNMIIMRILDAFMCFPMLLLALVIAAVLGSGLENIIIAMSVAVIPGYARVTHGLTLSIKESDYIMAQRTMGSSSIRIMLRHILPNAIPSLLVLVTMQLGTVILAEAGLSFLGIGIDPPGAAWGAMVSDGYSYLTRNPALWLAPGVAIALVVFAFNIVGDSLRDALDPRLRGLL
ncbi:MAG: ABC transporter permease [Dehalococcoidales bacterium]|nr:ABC transporter permease [Dehalococcoidales bacterium]